MVSTRKSTGSLPVPKRKNLADSDYSEDDSLNDEGLDEEVDEPPARKRAKKGQNTTQRNVKRTAKHSKPTSDDASKRIEKDTDNLDASSGEVATKVPSRVSSLITGPESKSVLVASNGRTRKKASRRDCVRKSDLGKLARMMDLSVEVFCEIATYCSPIDLLSLSRTTRNLREFLMSRSSRAIWAACIAATGMPPCPSDLTEPQYANLYFEKECHACGYPRVERLTDHLRIRLCKGCSKLNVVQGKEVIKENFDPKVAKVYEIYTLIPWSGMDVSDPNSFRVVNARIQSRYYLKYDFLEVVKSFLQTKPNSAERKAFLEKRHQALEEIAKSVREVAAWQQQRSRDKFDADDELCKKRRSQISNKLCSLGYSHEEIASMWTMRYDSDHTRENWSRLVYQPRELTDRIWSNIQVKLEGLIQQKRRFDHRQRVEKDLQRRRTELLSFYKEYVEHRKLDTADGVPLCFVDLCLIPLVKDLLEEKDCTVEMTPERWRIIEEKLPELREIHARKVEQDCLAILLSAKQDAQRLEGTETIPTDTITPDSDIDRSVLWRADAFFRLNFATDDMTSFADLLSLRRTTMFSYPNFSWGVWDPTRIHVDVLKIQAANALLSSLNLPEATTMISVTLPGQSFVCQQCDPVLRKRMAWGELVHHVFTEVQKYRQAQRIRRAPEVPLLETHKMNSNGAPLAIEDPNFIEPAVDSFTYANGVHGGQKFCDLCQRKGLFYRFLYKEQIAAHVRTYHGIGDDMP